MQPGTIILGLLLPLATPAELVQEHLRSVALFDGVEFELTFREVCEAPTELDGITIREGSCFVRHDGADWRLWQRELYRSANETRKLEESRLDHEWLVSKSVGEIIVETSDEHRTPRYVIANLTARPTRESVGTADSFMMLLGFNYGDGGRSLSDVFGDSRLEAHEDVLNGHTTWKLQSEGRYGRTTIWFDPSAAMQVCRLHREKSGSDLLNDIPISQLPAANPDKFSPGGKIRTIETFLDISKFGKWNDSYYPIDGVIQSTTSYFLGQQSSIRYSFHIDKFRRCEFTEADFKIRSSIPDGYAVQVDDQPNIEYEWRGGQIVKAISAVARANLLTSRFGSSFSIAGYFLSFSIVVLLLTTLLVWRYRRAES